MTTTASPDVGYGIPAPGYRLPSATRLGRVRLQIGDLERSIAYYGRVIGLRVLERRDGVAVLGAQEDDRPLVELWEKPGVNPVPKRGRLGLYHFAILLPERAALGWFLGHLEQIGAYAGMSDHFVSEAIYLTDPDGLGIEVYADRPRSAWRQEGGQLVMTTVPLDEESLLRAATESGRPDDVRFAGLPAGTVIGHVHLHVGDLDAAAAFYHQGLGLDKTVWSYPGALFLSAGGYHHHLGANTWAAHAPLAGPEDARLLDWEVLLPASGEAAEAARSLTSAGHPVRRDGDDWLANDPWGTTVRLKGLPDGAAT